MGNRPTEVVAVLSSWPLCLLTLRAREDVFLAAVEKHLHVDDMHVIYYYSLLTSIRSSYDQS